LAFFKAKPQRKALVEFIPFTQSGNRDLTKTKALGFFQGEAAEKSLRLIFVVSGIIFI